ncbi:olfactory receptor 13A1 [Bos indicus x Bos taurus]|uniref:Olfactory receptor n=1 Tax=Bos indicus x Bos taurus TaxID=30522 RepID=A0A4W2IMU2_BOBOX|nr:olfactory receptor 13A1 [Bos indicus x Bos taurus]XP_061261856.1 olfactory receptor 13A1 [Bos javanicus]
MKLWLEIHLIVPETSFSLRTMSNQTLVTKFVLQGFSEHPEYRVLLFSCFLSLYSVALTGNILIILAIAFNPRLRTPMYFFLFNLATMDIICTSSIMPKALEGLVLEENSISYGGCMAQLYFLTWAASSELLLLSVMAYDRYAAICHPLHYSTAMSKAFCGMLVAGVWALCAFNTAIHAGLMLRLDFCGPNVVAHFFCEVPPLLLLSCSSTYVNSIMIVLADAFYGILNFLMTIVSYGFIIASILKMRTAEGKKKAFSTCSSHLVVVCVYYAAVFCAYISPVSSYSAEKSKLAGVLYTMLSPTLNPLIYTLRNKEVKAALRKLFAFFRN